MLETLRITATSTFTRSHVTQCPVNEIGAFHDLMSHISDKKKHVSSEVFI